MKYILPILFASFLIGCKSTEQTTSSQTIEDKSLEQNHQMADPAAFDKGTPANDTKPEVIRGKLGDIKTPSDHFWIDTAYIKGDILFATVNFSGGCGDHAFDCIGSMAVAKSLPPQRAIRILHKNYEDNCEGIMSRQLEINILQFAENPGGSGEIILNLDGYKHPLNYKRK